MEFNIKIQDKLSKAIEKMRAATEQLQEKEFKRILVIGDINGEPPYILRGTRDEFVYTGLKDMLEAIRNSDVPFLVLPPDAEIKMVECTPIIDSIKKSLDRSPPQRKNPFVYSNSESWRKRRK